VRARTDSPRDPLARAAARIGPRVEAAIESALAAAGRGPNRLDESMRYSVFAGGKRLRPLLCCLACEACGGRASAALPAAAAIELVHTYSLVHDDLPAMDDDDFRRGRPTNHRVFGDAVAILAGDALLTVAFETLAGASRDAGVARALVRELARAAGVRGMVGGQVDDMLAEGKSVRGKAAVVRSIHERKTARLLAATARMGAVAAGAPASLVSKLGRYGEALGLAFQIADDLLDVEGSSSDLGKRAQKDGDRKKATYPAAVGVEASRREAARLARAAERAARGLEREAELRALARFSVERRR